MHGGSRHGSRGHARPGARGSAARGTPGKAGAARGNGASGGKADRSAATGAPDRRRETAYAAGSQPDSDRLVRLLEPVAHAMGIDLESVRVTGAGRRRLLRVVVDADGGVSLDTIALASREMSARLDGAADMGDLPYTLEVSSPGVDRPLTQPRHWRRAIGRLVIAPLTGEAAAHSGNEVASVEGRITGSSDTGVTLDCDGVLREYTYAELGPGRVQVEFGHLDPGEDEEPFDTGQGGGGLGGH
jgi:ribosome maturation factor RimP